MELEPGTNFTPQVDRRPRIPEPLPVRLIAVDDVRLPAPAGQEERLDAFYVRLLWFQRDERRRSELVYRADNFRLLFDLKEPWAPPQPPNDDFRHVGIELASLAEVEEKLIELEWPYERHKSVMTGRESLVLLDPAGNWVEVFERKHVG